MPASRLDALLLIEARWTNEMFQKLYESCLGIFYGQVVPDPDIRSIAKDSRIRRMCYYCNSRTNCYCFWCKCWLYKIRPKKEKKNQSVFCCKYTSSQAGSIAANARGQ